MSPHWQVDSLPLSHQESPVTFFVLMFTVLILIKTHCLSSPVFTDAYSALGTVEHTVEKYMCALEECALKEKSVWTSFKNRVSGSKQN